MEDESQEPEATIPPPDTNKPGKAAGKAKRRMVEAAALAFREEGGSY
jgi:hypothetical protein